MRVLHVLAELSHSGAERMLACSYEHWRRAGFEPVLVGMSDGEHPFAPVLADTGYGVVVLPPVRSAQGLAALRHTIRKERPTIVHIHTESCFDAVALIAATSTSVEGVVRTIHSSFCFTGMLRGRRAVRTSFSNRLGVVDVACSSEVAEVERSYFGNSVRVVENWVDVGEIARGATPQAGAHVRRELGIEPEAKVLALVGNCGGAKNHELIAIALQNVERPVHLLHVGGTTYQPEAEERAWLEVPSRHTTHHLGVRDDVPSLLAASDHLAFPSLYEGMGLVPAEALCAGVPVLAADTVGLQWLAAVGSARLVEFGKDAWAEAITEALSRDDGIRGSIEMDRARIRFGVERGVSEYVGVYESSLHRRLPLSRVRSRLTSSGAGG